MRVAKRPVLARDPLTDEELERLTADEFVRTKLTIEEKARLREINKERTRERTDRSARLRIEEAPILSDLLNIGCDVDSVWALGGRSAVYADAIPVLLKHLVLPYSDRMREGIARALAIPHPEVRKAWRLLAEEYRTAPYGQGVIAPGDIHAFQLGAKDGLACALSEAVTDANLEELIEIIKNPVHGPSRILLLPALRKSKNPLAALALDELAKDPELHTEIASRRRR